MSHFEIFFTQPYKNLETNHLNASLFKWAQWSAPRDSLLTAGLCNSASPSWIAHLGWYLCSLRPPLFLCLCFL